MGETQALLGKIAALRERLEQVRKLTGGTGLAPSLTCPAAPAASSRPEGSEVQGRLHDLAQRINDGFRTGNLMEGAVRRLVSATVSAEAPPLPARLTARARRIIERGRGLLGRLRTLGDEPLLQRDDSDP